MLFAATVIMKNLMVLFKATMNLAITWHPWGAASMHIAKLSWVSMITILALQHGLTITLPVADARTQPTSLVGSLRLTQQHASM